MRHHVAVSPVALHNVRISVVVHNDGLADFLGVPSAHVMGACAILDYDYFGLGLRRGVAPSAWLVEKQVCLEVVRVQLLRVLFVDGCLRLEGTLDVARVCLVRQVAMPDTSRRGAQSHLSRSRTEPARPRWHAQPHSTRLFVSRLCDSACSAAVVGVADVGGVPCLDCSVRLCILLVAEGRLCAGGFEALVLKVHCLLCVAGHVAAWAQDVSCATSADGVQRRFVEDHFLIW